MLDARPLKWQQLVLLTITLSILAGVILILHRHEQTHSDLYRQIGIHQFVVYHVGKAREELDAMKLRLLIRQLNGRFENLEPLITNPTFDDLNDSVSIHALRNHIGKLLSLERESGRAGPLSLKLERQFDDLLAAAGRQDPDSEANLKELGKRIAGLTLSLEQIEGLNNLQIKQLTSLQTRVAQRQNFALIWIISTLAILSYLSIAWVMGRIRKMMEEQGKLTRTLESKNAELERFTYTVSHDLKTPLVTIKNFVGRVERDLEEGNQARAREDMQRVCTAADDMATLLDDLLKLSRVGHVVSPPQTGRLNELIEAVVAKLRPKIEARGVELQIDDDMPDYWGDRLRLQEVFQNIIENAVKFMGDQQNPLIRISARESDGELICSVSDNGIGIDPQYMQRIFNLFERLDQSVEGTGIGLAIAQRIVEAHGGRIWVESGASGSGCTLLLSLPKRPDVAESLAS